MKYFGWKSIEVPSEPDAFQWVVRVEQLECFPDHVETQGVDMWGQIKYIDRESSVSALVESRRIV